MIPFFLTEQINFINICQMLIIQNAIKHISTVFFLKLLHNSIRIHIFKTSASFEDKLLYGRCPKRSTRKSHSQAPRQKTCDSTVLNIFLVPKSPIAGSFAAKNPLESTAALLLVSCQNSQNIVYFLCPSQKPGFPRYSKNSLWKANIYWATSLQGSQVSSDILNRCFITYSNTVIFHRKKASPSGGRNLSPC